MRVRCGRETFDGGAGCVFGCRVTVDKVQGKNGDESGVRSEVKTWVQSEDSVDYDVTVICSKKNKWEERKEKGEEEEGVAKMDEKIRDDEKQIHACDKSRHLEEEEMEGKMEANVQPCWPLKEHVNAAEAVNHSVINVTNYKHRVGPGAIIYQPQSGQNTYEDLSW